MRDEIPKLSDLKDLTDREILLVLCERLRFVSINQCNHLRHHELQAKKNWTLIIACLSAGLVGMMNLGIAMIILFFRS